jgi:hypothetical protein
MFARLAIVTGDRCRHGAAPRPSFHRTHSRLGRKASPFAQGRVAMEQAFVGIDMSGICWTCMCVRARELLHASVVPPHGILADLTGLPPPGRLAGSRSL